MIFKMFLSSNTLFQLVSYHISLILIVIGGLLYLSFRPDFLLMFGWADFLGLDNVVHQLRNQTAFMLTAMPEFIIYSLPNGLWIFSFGVLMLAIWGIHQPFQTYIWTAALLAVGISSEVLQITGLIPGTFDILDVVAYLGGALFVYLYHSINLFFIRRRLKE